MVTIAGERAIIHPGEHGIVRGYQGAVRIAGLTLLIRNGLAAGAMLPPVKHDPSVHGPHKEFRDETHAQLLEDVQNRQRNTVWPDTMRNGRAMDALLWRGAPDAKPVQRVGIAVFGLLFLSLGLFFIFSIAPEFHSMLGAVLGVLLSGLGVRVTFNAFRRNPKHIALAGRAKR